MQIYWLWLMLLESFTRSQRRSLLTHFSDPEAIYQCTDFSGCDLLPAQKEALLKKDLKQAKTMENVCRRKRISILTILDRKYPARLRNIPDPPLVLFYRGTLPDFGMQPAIGVVGTRKATAYGLNISRQFGSQIAECGGIVVSGGALGVDAMASQGALEAKGTTVVVLGCGADIAYPAVNRNLFAQIENEGCILSEYFPGERPKPWHFPERNRIISGLSNGVLVIEAPAKSGALITARDAMDQGRDVYAVPANIDMPSCEGSNALLSEGAAAVFTGWDILRQYEAQYPDAVAQRSSAPRRTNLKVAQLPVQPITDKKDIDNPAPTFYSGKNDTDTPLTETEQKVLACLSGMPRPMDEVMAQLELPPGEVLTVLTHLSVRGMVNLHPGRLVSARKQ